MPRQRLYFGRLFAALATYTLSTAPLSLACWIALPSGFALCVPMINGAYLVSSIGLYGERRWWQVGDNDVLTIFSAGFFSFLALVLLVGRYWGMDDSSGFNLHPIVPLSFATLGLTVVLFWTPRVVGRFDRNDICAFEPSEPIPSIRLEQTEGRNQGTGRFKTWWFLAFGNRSVVGAVFVVALAGYYFGFAVCHLSYLMLSGAAADSMAEWFWILAIVGFLPRGKTFLRDRHSWRLFTNRQRRAVYHMTIGVFLAAATLSAAAHNVGASDTTSPPENLGKHPAGILGCGPLFSQDSAEASETILSDYAACIQNRFGVEVRKNTPNNLDAELQDVVASVWWTQDRPRILAIAHRQIVICVVLVLIGLNFLITRILRSGSVLGILRSEKATHWALLVLLAALMYMAPILLIDVRYPLHRIWTADLFALVNSYYYPLLAAGAALIVVLYIRNLRWFVKHGGA
jgi:hypothetical protein